MNSHCDVLWAFTMLNCESSQWCTVNHNHDELLNVALMYCEPSPWRFMNHYHVFKNHRHDVLWITVTMVYYDWCELQSPWCTVNYHHKDGQQHVLTIIFKSICISSCSLALSLCTKWFYKHKVYSYTHIIYIYVQKTDQHDPSSPGRSILSYITNVGF